jgi:hypothetical protein
VRFVLSRAEGIENTCKDQGVCFKTPSLLPRSRVIISQSLWARHAEELCKAHLPDWRLGDPYVRISIAFLDKMIDKLIHIAIPSPKKEDKYLNPKTSTTRPKWRTG